MINEDEETTNDRREIPSLRRRVAQYDEYATHFTRLAEAEPVASIRRQWETAARDYSYLARALGGGGHRDVEEGA